MRCSACQGVFATPAPSVAPTSASPGSTPFDSAAASPPAPFAVGRPPLAAGDASVGAPTARGIPGVMHAAYRIFAWSLLLYVPLTVLTILVVGDVGSAGGRIAAQRAGLAGDLVQGLGWLLGAITLLSLLTLLLGMLAIGRTPHFRGPAFYGDPSWGTRAVAVFGIVCLPLSVLVFALQALRHSLSPPPSRP